MARDPYVWVVGPWVSMEENYCNWLPPDHPIVSDPKNVRLWRDEFERRNRWTSEERLADNREARRGYAAREAARRAARKRD